MSDSITKLTDNLIASYAKVGGINHLDGGNLPSKFAIASITTDLLRLLLPGFFDEKPIQTSELKVEISMLMDSVCLLYTSPSPRDRTRSRMPSSA